MPPPLQEVALPPLGPGDLWVRVIAASALLLLNGLFVSVAVSSSVPASGFFFRFRFVVR